MILNKFKLFFSKLFSPQSYKIQSFTYYVPAPKQGLKAYREKQFDRIFYEFINKGFEILDFKTQLCQDRQGTSGMWLIFILKALNQEANNLDLDDGPYSSSDSLTDKLDFGGTEYEKDIQMGEDELELPEIENDTSEDIEGLYYIKDNEK